MHVRTFLFVGAFALAPLAFAAPAAAEDTRPAAAGHVLVFPDNTARFHVTRDLSAGRMVFVPADPTLKISEPPVITLRSATGPKDVTVTAVAGERGAWVVTHDLLKTETFDGTMAIMVGEKKYTTPLVLTAVRTPKNGGQLLAMCDGAVEAVHDVSTGTLTIIADTDVKLAGTPMITVSEPKDAAEVKLVAVSGKPNTWQVKADVFKTTNVAAVLKVTVDGKPCEAPIVFTGPHGGRIVTWTEGPRYEIVPETNTIYFLDEQWNGKTYTIEDPVIVYGTGPSARTVRLEPVPNEPRAYRVVGAGASLSQPGDARLRLSLFGKTLETGLGVSGVGVNIR